MKKKSKKEIKFITAPPDVYGYLTPNKKYEVMEVVSVRPFGDATVKIIADDGDILLTSILGSAHSRSKGNFIPN